MMMAKRRGPTIALYARVSTVDQTLKHQERQAEAAGFKIDLVVADHGVSGVSTKFAERPEARRLFDLLREGDTLVVRWVDRLGRNYVDMVDTIRQFMRSGVIVRTIIHNMTFDGAARDPMSMAVRDALIGFMAASAAAQAEATREAQKAGIAYAREMDETAYRGRKPTYTREQLATVREMLGRSVGVAEIAKHTKLSRQAIYRIKGDEMAAEAAVERWGLSESDEDKPAGRMAIQLPR